MKGRWAIAVVLTALASLLLLALVLLPRWLDSPSGRAALLAILSDLTGTQVSVEGAVAFALLPRPNFTLARLRLSEGGGGVSGAVDRVDAELDLAGLLAGRLVPWRLQVVRPNLVFHDARQRLLELPLLLARLPVASAEIIGGRFQLAQEEGEPLIFEDLELSLRPGRVEGARWIESHMRSAGERLRLELEAGPLRPGGQAPVDMRLVVGPGEEYGELVFTGLVGGAGRFAGDVRVTVGDPRALSALAALAGLHGLTSLPLPPDGLSTSLGVRLEPTAASLALEEGRLTLPGGEVRFSGQLKLAAPWDLALELRIRHWRADGLPSPAAIDRLLSGLLSLPFTGTAAIAADRIELAGVPVENLRARLRAESGGLLLEDLRAALPAGGDIRLGAVLHRLPAEDRARIDVSLMLPALHETLAALADREPVPDWLPRTLTVDVAVRRTRANWSFDRIELLADGLRASFSGGLEQSVRPRVVLAGSMARLQLDSWLPALSGETFSALLEEMPFDLDLDLAIADLRLGPARIEQADLALRLRDGQLRIDRLALRNLAGASFDASGRLDPRSGEFDARIDGLMPAPARLLRLFGLPAEPLLLALGSIETRLELSRRGDFISAEGRLGSKHLSLAADFRGQSADLRGLVSADLRINVPDLGELVRAAGIPFIAPVGSATGFELQTAFTRSAPDVVLTAAHGRLTDATFSLDGEWRTPADRLPEWVGRLQLDRLPPQAVIDILYQLAQPLAAWPPGPPWQWLGAWPAASLARVGTNAVAVDLELLVDAGRGRLRILAAPGRFVLEGLRWPFAEGQLFGGLTLVGRDELVVATGRLGFADVELAALFDSGAPPPLAGRLRLDLQFSGRGRSPAEIVANLAGSGRFTLREGAMPDLRPSRAPLAMTPGPRLLSVGLGGEMRLGRGLLRPVEGALQVLADHPLELAVEIDLYAWMIEARLREHDSRAGAVRSLARLFGPLDRPEWHAEPTATAGPAPSVRGGEHVFGPH